MSEVGYAVFVVDRDGKPIPGLSVKLDGMRVSGQTDQDGGLYLGYLAPLSRHVVAVDHEGFEDLETAFTVPESLEDFEC